jgi:hypothetical protein
MTLVPVVLLAGCGGDDSAPETPIVTPTVEEPTELSKEQLITAGDGVCAEVNAALGSLSSEATDAASAAGQRADLYEGMMDRLRDLGVPEDRAGLDEVLSAGDDLIEAEQDAEEAAVDGDDTALASAESEAATAGATFSDAATSFGFEDCGQGPTAPVTAAPDPSATAPVVPAEPVPTTPAAPVTPAPPSGGAGTDTGTDGGGTGDTGGTTGGSGGVGPG